MTNVLKEIETDFAMCKDIILMGDGKTASSFLYAVPYADVPSITT